jgi:hypothetical protein
MPQHGRGALGASEKWHGITWPSAKLAPANTRVCQGNRETTIARVALTTSSPLISKRAGEGNHLAGELVGLSGERVNGQWIRW